MKVIFSICVLTSLLSCLQSCTSGRTITALEIDVPSGRIDHIRRLFDKVDKFTEGGNKLVYIDILFGDQSSELHWKYIAERVRGKNILLIKQKGMAGIIPAKNLCSDIISRNAIPPNFFGTFHRKKVINEVVVVWSPSLDPDGRRVKEIISLLSDQ